MNSRARNTSMVKKKKIVVPDVVAPAGVAQQGRQHAPPPA
jgi:hypothetical protein